MINAIDDVTARVAEIQNKIVTLQGLRPPMAAVGQSNGAADSAQFAAALQEAQQEQTGTSPEKSLLPASLNIAGRTPARGATTNGGLDSVAAVQSWLGSGRVGQADSPAAPGSGDRIVEIAKKYLGIPYVWGGTNPKTGLDCSGLVQLVMKQMGISVPRVAADQAKVGREISSLAKAQPGDLIVLRGGKHIGIYVGDGMMLHAPKRGDVVKIGKVYATPDTIRRLVPTMGSGVVQLSAAAGGAPNIRATLAGAASGQPAAADRINWPTNNPAVLKWAPVMAEAGAAHGLDPRVLAAVMQAESGGRMTVVSNAGAIGLMQFMPGTARELNIDPRNPQQAIHGAAKLLSQHLTRFGSLELALAAYNAGPGAVRKFDGIPPYRETQQYVQKITAMLGGRK